LTSRLPPRLRDTTSPEDRIRQSSTNLEQLGVGFMRGRFRPLRPLGTSSGFGEVDDAAPGDTSLLRFVNADTATWSGTGNLVIGLSFVPWSDSLQAKLNGHELEPADWTYDETLNTVTIYPETWWQTGERGTAYYAYFNDADPVPTVESFEDAVIAVGDPILWATLGDASGTTAQDATTHNRDGTYGGTVALGEPALASGLPGTAVDFTGTGWVDYGTGEAWQRSTPFSAMIWAKPHTAAFDMFMFGCDDLGALGPDRCWNIVDDTAARIYSGSGDYPADGGEAIGHLTADVTAMLLLTFDGSTLKFYKDDTLVQTTTGGAMNTSTTYPLTIGASANGRVGRFAKFDGLLQHAVMWDVVATAAQVAKLWQTGSGA